MGNKTKVKERVFFAVSNAERLSLAELESIQTEAENFIETLPYKERGAFYWTSRLECLSMLVSALRRGDNQ